MRRLICCIATVFLLAGAVSPALRAQDSTGVHLSSIPDWIPETESKRLAKQKKLLETAVDSIDAAIHRFNLRCAAIATAAALAACQGEMTELQKGGVELEQLKVQFNADVEKTSKKFSGGGVSPEKAGVGEEKTPATGGARKPTGIKGGGSAMQQAQGAKAAGERATKNDKADKDEAGKIFDTPGEAAPESEVSGGERKPLVIPRSLRKNPDFMKLETRRINLEKERRALFEELSKANGNPAKIAVIKQKLAGNEQDAVWVRFEQEKMIKAAR